MRADLAARAVVHCGAEGGLLTVSMGVATLTPDAATRPSDLVAAADRRLYHAKHLGRNRVVTHDPVPAPSGPDRPDRPDRAPRAFVRE